MMNQKTPSESASGDPLRWDALEQALRHSPQVVEAGVVAVGNPATLYAFVVLKPSALPSRGLRRELIQTVAAALRPELKPDHLVFVADLPKTHAGEVLRDLLAEMVLKKSFDVRRWPELANPEAVAAILALLEDEGEVWG